MKQYYFLSGLQRSGSTLLGSLLNQNPNIHVSTTSPLLDYLYVSEDILQRMHTQFTFDKDLVSPNLHKRIFQGFYDHIEKPIIVDKNRGWLQNVNSIKSIMNIEPRVICTYRPLEEIITSFIKLLMNDPNNSVDAALKSMGTPMNNRNRAMFIWEKWTFKNYQVFKHGIEHNPESLFIVHYKDLVNDTQNTVNKIYDFLELDRYKHRFQEIKNSCAEERDEVWGVSGLHDVRPTIEWQSLEPTSILDEDLIKFFRTYDQKLGIDNLKRN